MKVLFTSLILVTLGMNTATAETLQDCIDTADNSQRLACYDRIFGHTKSSNSVVSDSYNSSNSTPTYGNPEDTFGLERKVVASSPENISSAITGKIKHWKPGVSLKLDNGQIWEIKSGRKIYYPITNPKVTIKKASLGSFLMNIEGLNSSFKVKRIK